MIQIGKINQLQVVNQADAGAYLSGGTADNLLLPKREVPAGIVVGDWLTVFVYPDSDGFPTATTQMPAAQLGECAYLKVKDVNRAGAFLDWGLPKDLLAPFSEQHTPFQANRSYVITLRRDKHSGRMIASSQLDKYLSETGPEFKQHQAVDLLICGRSDMGYKAVVNHTHLGLIFRDDAYKPLRYGQRLAGFIKGVRQDGKIDLSLQLPAGAGMQELTERILEHLRRSGGRSRLTDKAAPDDIYHHFSVSKKNYKKALGVLYKQRAIIIEPDHIRLTDKH